MDLKLHILQHTLGVGDYNDKKSYRNHFVTGVGSTDYPVCQELVELGLMEIRPMSKSLTGFDDCYSVTQEGIDYVALHSPKRPPEPKLSRGQKRYKRYLEYGDAFRSFLEFCLWDSSPERSWNGG